MRIFFTFLFLAIGFQNVAQSFSDGSYNTTYGTVNLTFEIGYEYPNGGMVYGDYKGIGTITGTTTNNGKELIGSFHNGAAEGKFIFFSPSGKQNFFDNGITSFNGNWGYGTDNKYSTNSDHIWNATSKIGGKETIKNVTNVWSGKWNTTDGNLILQQVGNKVTGTYKGIGTVDAMYNPQTRKLKGTFHNNSTQKTGHFEFNFEGNSFKGKWGWTSAMANGVWNGDKQVKNNKEVPKVSQTEVNTNAIISSKSTTKYIVKAESITVDRLGVYGFFGLKLFKVTASGRTQVVNFGNKSSDLFNTTENTRNKWINGNKIFHDSPEFYREFILDNSDLNDENVKFEIEFYSHMKVRIVGSNPDFGFKKEIVRLDQLKAGSKVNLISQIGGDKCILTFGLSII